MAVVVLGDGGDGFLFQIIFVPLQKGVVGFKSMGFDELREMIRTMRSDGIQQRRVPEETHGHSRGDSPINC